ncbi:hypothetical protein E0K89_013110 [Aquicoccus sp. SCR17]|nr:hypothetical protein [Carideicomes alvinocaridis]
MLAKKPVGRNAPAMKYDILSALGVAALRADKHRQRLMLRMMVLITTRYNWQNGELSIGRAEMARLWSVDERTVKRELGKLREAGWMRVRRPGARGRVTVYEFDLVQLLIDTRDIWPEIGPDFEARMQEARSVPQAPQEGDAKVVPLRRPGQAAEAPERALEAPGGVAAGDGAGEGDLTLWPRVLEALERRDPAAASAWFRQLREVRRDGGRVILEAPSAFVATYVATHLSALLVAAYGRYDASVRAVTVEVAGA